MLVTQTVVTMGSHEIAELTQKRHDNVKRTIEDLHEAGLIGNPQIEEIPTATRPMRVFLLNKRDTLVVVARLSPEFTARVIDRWQELESRLAPVPIIPQTMAQALRLAADQAEQLEQQKAELEAAAPKVEFVDQYVRASGSKGFREVCKLLNAKEPEFRLFLVERKVMYRLGDEWMPYQQHIDAGRFEIKAGVARVSEHAYNRAMFTPKGVNWIAAEWAKHRLAHSLQGKAVAA